jgi:ATP-dependent Clp protease ATP-binding subunit ClpB
MRSTVETFCREALRNALLSGQQTNGTLVAQHGHLVIDT